MKSRYGFLVLLLLAISCSSGGEAPLPRVAIAGLAIESSTFSPARTHEAAFRAKRGEEIFTSYPFYAADSPTMARAEYFPALTGRAIPGGTVTREAYESLMTEMLDRLRESLPYDGSVFGHTRCDERGRRRRSGRRHDRAGSRDCWRRHVDFDDHGFTRQRVLAAGCGERSDYLLPHGAARGRDRDQAARIGKPAGSPRKRCRTTEAYKAWIPVPILLPGEKTSTRVEPANSLYAMIPEVEALDGVIDAAIWMGYPWADEPRNHAVVMVYGDEQADVASGAERLANFFWDSRHEFVFVGPVATLEEALDAALQSDDRPFIISDSGDNPTAGGAGDVTWTLTEVLKREEFAAADGPSVIYASIPDQQFADRALEIGVGGDIDMPAGARVDGRYAPPVRLTGRIQAISTEDPDAEVEVVVRVGSVDVIVTRQRKPYHYEADFARIDLDPRSADIVMVKIGYLVPELYDMRGGWLMALTPGGVDQDLLRLPYERIQRPIIPLDPDMGDPDLDARLVPLSHRYPASQ